MVKLSLRFGGVDPEFDHQCEIVKDYLSAQVSQGVPVKELKKTLSQNGWSRKHIREALRRCRLDLKGQHEAPSQEIQLEKRYEMSKGTPLVQVQGVSKIFGSNQVLDAIDLEVKHQDIIGIIGLSGSGKSTLLNTMIGFTMPENGQILFNTGSSMVPMSAKKRELRAMYGFAPQEPSFYRRLTTWENLDHFGSLYKIDRKQRRQLIEKILSEMGLTDAKQTLGRNLSGGMQRRLSIACSMIHQPQILILDEPTADLDPYLRREIWNLIRRINNLGTTIILTSHFLTEVEGLCNKIALLHDRKIQAFGSPDELRKSFSASHEIVLTTEAKDYNKIIASLQKDGKLKISDIVQKGDKLMVYSPDAEKVLHSLIHHVEKDKQKIVDIELNRPSLDEIFESYVIKGRAQA